jgi:hypothetical protein
MRETSTWEKIGKLVGYSVAIVVIGWILFMTLKLKVFGQGMGFVATFMYGIVMAYLIYLVIEMLCKKAIKGESKVSRQEIAKWLKESHYQEFTGQVRVTTRTIKESKEVIRHPKIAGIVESSVTDRDICFCEGTQVNNYPFRKAPNDAHNGYGLWYFGRYLMVRHLTKDGYGKPYVKVS